MAYWLHRYRLLRLILLCTVVFFNVGCELFQTRDAEPPDSGNVGVFLQPDRPEVVLDNLVSAVENLNALN